MDKQITHEELMAEYKEYRDSQWCACEEAKPYVQWLDEEYDESDRLRKQVNDLQAEIARLRRQLEDCD